MREDSALLELDRRHEAESPAKLPWLAIVDRGAWLIYDWLRIGPGTMTRTRYTCHAEPFYSTGVNGYPRGRGETNVAWTPDQGLPLPNVFVAQSAHTIFGSATEQDLALFRENYALEVQICQKIFYQVPLMAVPAHGVILPDKPDPVTPDDAPMQPHDFSDYPRIILPGMYTGINFEGNPVTLRSDGRGVAVLPLLRGTMDRQVQ